MAYGFDSSLQAPALPAPLSNDVPKKDSFTPILVKIQHCLGWEGEVFKLPISLEKSKKLLAFINARKQNSNNCSLKRPQLSKLIRGFCLIN